uniref:Putative secreted peptide n=1 Tax=Anopheles braziliensis TaxID=58242 RepID=A0A2M3ZNC0_9DIPT
MRMGIVFPLFVFSISIFKIDQSFSLNPVLSASSRTHIPLLKGNTRQGRVYRQREGTQERPFDPIKLPYHRVLV